MLAKPREALEQAGAGGAHGLGPAAEHARQSSQQAVGGPPGSAGVGPRISWNATAGPPCWRAIAWSWARFSSGFHDDARCVAEGAGDLAVEMHEP